MNIISSQNNLTSKHCRYKQIISQQRQILRYS